ncbi:MAG TPA: tRNA (uridine(34)/cytosine(34)/5-carboxymethylaminomethyluridine(34)-2'-O)-methyltransferase TrmL [Bdellovibrionales bacterium]|nr:tRNA (uridine(34)/cytosine(34)/5-carboxymethylaminomethyluridine(34)-2'-O)-methyltransferase TrmL [Pseudobdellovibrionaceae bacterium]HAG90429.1 tRNA (uridine(34)/cytosine(34)/5-carboxymethylaminomethyluridine(34)-2'-O)-methyltransferase TrmL [Bdellovibrionales bacterium]|tara:strand:+ start:73 stop:546 length:474 start_codon:yes stop_codon:yes gene_type:complete
MSKPPSLNVVLIEPEIPSNTGNIGRSCVGYRAQLHVVGKLGFELSDKRLRRAGLDYWPHLTFAHHPTFEAWWSKVQDPSRVFLFTTKSSKDFSKTQFQEGDWIVFGKETKGLDESLLAQFPDQCLTIPMPGPIRSLNLATSVAMVLFEAFRQSSDEP